MTYELEHFKKFHDDPASLSDDEFKQKVREWIIFVAETKGQINFKTKKWREIGNRFFAVLERRFVVTPELEQEFEILKARLTKEKVEEELNDEEDLRRHEQTERDLTAFVAFIKRYQLEFKFAPEYIKLNEDNLTDLREDIRIIKNLELEIKGLKYDQQQSTKKLDNSLTNFYDKTGKTFVMTALKDKKKHSGN